MNFIPAKKQHLKQIMTWFRDAEEVYQWGGPGFRFPYTIESFYTDCKLDEIDSFVLMDEANSVLAFGQFYARLDCCHLGRIAVAPSCRGKGYGQKLVNNLLDCGSQQLKTNLASLFVLVNNQSALRLYQMMGFSICKYPEKLPIEACIYMRKLLR